MTTPTESSATALEREHAELLEFLYLCPVGLGQVGRQGEIAMLNPKGAQLLMPLSETGLLTNLFDTLDAFAPELRERVASFTEPRGTVCEGLRMQVYDGEHAQRPSFLAIDIVKLDVDRHMVVLRDITATVKHERLIFADKQRFEAMFRGMRDALICTLDVRGDIATWNASGERLLGYSAPEVAGKSLISLGSSSNEIDQSSWPALLERVGRTGSSEHEAWYVRKNGARFWGEGVVSALCDERGNLEEFSVVLRDMTERKQAVERLVELATKDSLTGLANRRHFLEYAQKELVRWKRHAGPFAILMLDADHFKSVNDTYGHDGGDAVLRDLASILKASLRASDLAARYGGEEFIVLLPVTNAENALVVAERIRTTAASRQVKHLDRFITYTLSVGVAAAGPAFSTLEALISAADEALYAAKRGGRNRTVVTGA